VNTSRSLVTAGKHVDNSRAIARQLLGKRVPVSTDTHAAVDVFSMWFVPKCYKQDQLSSGVGKICTLDMICSVKPVLTEDLCVVNKEEFFSNMLLCAIRTINERPSIFIRDNPIFSSERMLHEDYYRKGSVGKKRISGRESQGGWRQDEVIGGKPLVLK
jgi:hypothetical protein